MKDGKITQASSGTCVEVKYELWVRGADEAGGLIRIGNDPVPGERFMGDPTSVFPGDLDYILETAGGVPVSVFFCNSDGTFVCHFADEARRALDGGG